MAFNTSAATCAVILAIMVASTPANAQIYKKVLPDGSVVFTDEPTSGGDPVQLEPLQTYTAPTKPKAQEQPAAPKTADKEQKPAFSYTAFAITEPANDAAIRANNGEVTVTLRVEPALNTAEGHTITLFLDGKPLSTPVAGNTVVLQNVDRGTHTVSALLRDAGKKVLRDSGSVTFHVLRHSALFLQPQPRQ